MFKQIQRLVAGALCTLSLTVAGMAPAYAHELVNGRGGQIRRLESAGNANTARAIAEEFVGLIHSVWMNHETNGLYWILQTRDGRQEIMVAEATLDEQDAIIAQGKIATGALKGATVSARGYHDEDRFVVDLRVSFGDTEVAFTQALEPVEATEE